MKKKIVGLETAKQGLEKDKERFKLDLTKKNKVSKCFPLNILIFLLTGFWILTSFRNPLIVKPVHELQSRYYTKRYLFVIYLTETIWLIHSGRA